MKIAIIGTGYVGLVTGACFAEMGNHIICADNDKQKIASLEKDKSPLYEPGLQELLTKNIAKKRITFTDSSALAIQKSDIVFNCVGTPLTNKKLPNLASTFQVAEIFAQNLDTPKIFINKSTVPVGTTEKCANLIKKITPKKQFKIASNPEFLRQGTAVNDFLNPDRIIIGTNDKKTKETLEKLYAPLTKNGVHLISTQINSAELIKYAANSFIATKISFINEIAGYCEKNNICIHDVSKGLGSDSRIGPRYLHAGLGYGGGCLSKDIKSLIELGNKNSHNFKILKQVSLTNNQQRNKFAAKIIKAVNPANKTFAIWGLSYKPDTDDLRDSPAVEIIKKLKSKEANLQLFDPAAMPNAKKIFPPSKQITYAKTIYQAAKNADALLILTEWEQFRAPDFQKLKKLMKGSYIFDGRNILNPEETQKNNFKYKGMGTKQLTS